MPKILCVDGNAVRRSFRRASNAYCPGQAKSGFLPADAENPVTFLERTSNMFWMERSDVEDDPNWLQIIPYVTFWHGGDVLSYTRSKGGEGRLTAKHSVGVGGHIEQHLDAGTIQSLPNVLLMAMMRELCEESEVRCHINGSLPKLRYDGLIYTGDLKEGGQVDTVHVGLACSMHLRSRLEVSLISNDDADEPTGIDSPQWLQVCNTVHDRASFLSSYELWSQEVLKAQHARTTPATSYYVPDQPLGGPPPVATGWGDSVKAYHAAKAIFEADATESAAKPNLQSSKVALSTAESRSAMGVSTREEDLTS